MVFAASGATTAFGSRLPCLGLAISFFSSLPSRQFEAGLISIWAKSLQYLSGTGRDSRTFGGKLRCLPWKAWPEFSITRPPPTRFR
ncbi:MAG: hypothetical protein DMF07_04160 [Verrucomicrobia bacterium]|nr:MAG: hypothetical protein DMF07_04160 [Verrucomicrobiota bacterium]